MKKVSVSKFRANMQSFLDDLKFEDEIWLTSHGLVIAKIVLPEQQRENARKKLAEIAKTAYVGDVLSPIEAEWNTENKLNK